MILKFSYDASVNSAPAEFKTALQKAADILDRVITNNISETIQVGWGETAGSKIPSNALASGGSASTGVTISYSQLTTALTATAKANGCSYIVANLPATDPINGSNSYSVCQAQAAALNISDPYASTIAGSIGFGSNINWAYSQSSIGRSQYDFIGAAMHEITHALGRVSGVSIPQYGVVSSLDLYTYASAGLLQANLGNSSQTAGGYFSINGGVTNLNNMDAAANGDPIDWASSVRGDSFGSGTSGVAGLLTNTDLLVLQAMGFNVPTAIGPYPSSGSVAVFLANLSNIATSGFSISDTATNVAVNIDSLKQNLGKLSSIALTDSNALSITSIQFSADVAVLGLISQNYSLNVTGVSAGSASTLLTNSHVSKVGITDSSTNIASNLDTLSGLASKISAIAITDSTPMSINATQLTADAGVLAEINSAYSLAVSGVAAANVNTIISTNTHVNSVSITDTNVNFLSNLNALNSNVSHISSITLTDSNALAITPTQQAADSQLLSKIVGGYTIAPNTVTLQSLGSTYIASPNQTISGTGGINSVVFSEPSSNFTVSITGSSATLVDTIGGYGTENLNNIQRVKFSGGTAIALDFQPGQDGFLTVMIIGTAFGADKVSNYFAPGVSLYDAGQTNLQIAALIEQLGLIETQIGSTSNKAWVDFVYQNVIGVPPDTTAEATYVNALNSGTYTKAGLLALAAGVADAGGGTLATQINLVGTLQAHGLSYTPVA